jgi:TrmH family RNA methyltransferase
MNGQGDVRFVLVRPRDPRNVGAACRAMKTMGFTSLAVVLGPLIDLEQAGVLAHHARDVLEGALFCTDLEQAIGDAALIAGTTRRRGRRRKYFALFPEQLAARVAACGPATVAVLFGNEETGLTDAELARCNLAVTIPASPGFPSLNLSHAVQVIAYELARALDRPHPTPFAPIAGRQVDDLASLMVRSLAAIGFRNPRGLQNLTVFFRDIVARAGLSPGEAHRLGVVFRKIAGLKTGRGIDP